ncbi:hypothetical protein Dsin_033054 [Dipteronia sinensis]|uniref:Nephrocystin 3-like N-terminal domain-containing protein n=1 Tax=Dipteronia sinensis TaxID=43782 RepID=A0AAE0DMB9_9ROSI|nr:hypothetical protein Dsin_033054 [Dipteronia sinensis]
MFPVHRFAQSGPHNMLYPANKQLLPSPTRQYLHIWLHIVTTNTLSITTNVVHAAWLAQNELKLRSSADASALKARPTEALTNGGSDHSNGNSSSLRHENGLTSPRARPATMRTVSSMSVSKKLTKQILTSSGHHGRVVGVQIKDEHIAVRHRCQKELGSHVGSYAYDTTFDGLLEWIRSERLIRVPHKGGNWDRVLIEVQHFAQQVHQLTESIAYFTDDCNAASHLMYGHCLLLLEFGLELVPLLRCHDMFGATPEISENISHVFSYLLNIVTAVAGTFWGAVHGGKESTTIDIYRVFSAQIETLYAYVTKTAHAIWCFCLDGDDETDIYQLEKLQKRLSPQDNVLTFLAARHMVVAARPGQFTCTWFQSHLNSFLRSNQRILRVEGKSGSGKTTLANWTLDRLQRPINRKPVTTISFFANPTIAGQNSGLALVRTLLYQLIFQRLGDEHLFRCIYDVVTPSLLRRSVQEQEDLLWAALNKGLSHLTDAEDDLVIVVDGIDGIGEKQVAQKACRRLWDLTEKLCSVRLIQFSQCIEMQATKNVTSFELTAEVLRHDMTTVTRRSLLRHQQFDELKEPDQDKIIEPLVAAAGTSMLWLTLACRYLRLQPQISSKSLEVLLPGSNCISVVDLVHKIVSATQMTQDSKNAISYILTAERPLLFSEIKLLLSDGPVPKPLDLDSIIQPLGPFVLVSEGLVAIRHKQVMNGLLVDNSPAKWLLNHQQRQKDLLLKVLTYASARFHEECQPTVDPLEFTQIYGKIHGHTLLEYAIRYWVRHFEWTSIYHVSGALTIPKDMQDVFPYSNMFALLEEGCWSTQVPAKDAVNLHITAFRVREALYGKKKGCVLQTAMTIGKIYEVTLALDECAVEWYHKAMYISKEALGLTSEMTMILCRTVLRITEKYLSPKQDDRMMIWRHDAFKLYLEILRIRYGEQSKEYLELWALYLVFRRLIGLEIIVVPGPTPGQPRGVPSFEGDVSLDGRVVVRKHKGRTEIDPFEDDFLFGYVKEGAVITLTLEMYQKIIIRISEHVRAGFFVQAEELYIELWLRLTEHCHTHHEVEWHERKIRVMIDYCRFLHKRERSTESASILLCIWRERSLSS